MTPAEAEALIARAEALLAPLTPGTVLGIARTVDERGLAVELLTIAREQSQELVAFRIEITALEAQFAEASANWHDALVQLEEERRTFESFSEHHRATELSWDKDRAALRTMTEERDALAKIRDEVWPVLRTESNENARRVDLAESSLRAMTEERDNQRYALFRAMDDKEAACSSLRKSKDRLSALCAMLETMVPTIRGLASRLRVGDEDWAASELEIWANRIQAISMTSHLLVP